MLNKNTFPYYVLSKIVYPMYGKSKSETVSSFISRLVCAWPVIRLDVKSRILKMRYLISFLVIFVVSLHFDAVAEAHCTPSITKVSAGDYSLGQLCSGQLVLNEEFDTFDTGLWEHEITLGGGGVSRKINQFRNRQTS